jgi:hypothetical protein
MLIAVRAPSSRQDDFGMTSSTAMTTSTSISTSTTSASRGSNQHWVLTVLWDKGTLDTKIKELLLWDKGTLDTKIKELCPGLPRAGSRVQHRIRTPSGYKLCQEGGQGQVVHQVLGAGPVPTGPGVWAHYVAGVLTPKAH